MPHFIDDNFLLQSEYARKLFHDHAKELPIIDYHNHLSPNDIANDRQFENLSAVWLHGDHYKWRAMRTLGIDEQFITGNASDEAKFSKWAYSVPFTIRNPLYHWSHLELKRYFGIDEQLNGKSALDIYKRANASLASPVGRTRMLLQKMKVQVLCTTDDPVDTLEDHERIAKDKFGIKVLPAFRPDKAYATDDPSAWNNYIQKLGCAANTTINSFETMMAALENRINYFHVRGCQLSDHGLQQLCFPREWQTHNVNSLFEKLAKGQPIDVDEKQYFTYCVLIELCRLYHKKGWTQQFHLGAIRNNTHRMLAKLGPDTGFDSIGDFSQAAAMSQFFNALDKDDRLAKTIVYNLNPADNEVFATMMGNFNDGSTKGKMQFGSAWWFLDQKDGIEKQLNSLSNLGLLSCFIGMLTDSRSFLSFPRHEYFRRILCNLIGNDVANHELPWDEAWLGKIVADICYHNAKEYFGFSGSAQ